MGHGMYAHTDLTIPHLFTFSVACATFIKLTYSNALWSCTNSTQSISRQICRFFSPLPMQPPMPSGLYSSLSMSFSPGLKKTAQTTEQISKVRL